MAHGVFWAILGFGSTFGVSSYFQCKIWRCILARQPRFSMRVTKFRAYLTQFSRPDTGQTENRCGNQNRRLSHCKYASLTTSTTTTHSVPVHYHFYFSFYLAFFSRVTPGQVKSPKWIFVDDWRRILTGCHPSYCQTNSVKAMERTQSSDPWSHPFIIHQQRRRGRSMVSLH